ncbi:MAG: hypothetical protein ACOX8W_02995 [bacterium]|jgi:hypothetical protein
MMDTIELLRQSRLETGLLHTQLWHENFLTYRWWLIVAVIAASYLVWWVLVDKRLLPELLLYGSFIAVARVIFDDWGILAGRWTYVVDLIHVPHTSLFLNDLTVFPLALMLVYQYGDTWARFLVLAVLTEGIISFVFLPFLAWVGILVLHDWSYVGTFLVTTSIAISMRAIMSFLLMLTRRYRGAGGKAAEVLRPVFSRNMPGYRNRNKV